MSARFLLPCDCGRKTTVDLRQAGRTVACPCGRSLDVPTMRRLRTMERVERAEETVRPWSNVRGGVFAVGAALAVLSGVVAVLLLARGHYLDTQKPTIRRAAFEEWADGLTPEKSWQAWQELTDFQRHPLERPTPTHVRNRRTKKTMKTAALAALAMGALGAVLAAGALLARPAGLVKRNPR